MIMNNLISCKCICTPYKAVRFDCIQATPLRQVTVDLIIDNQFDKLGNSIAEQVLKIA